MIELSSNALSVIKHNDHFEIAFHSLTKEEVSAIIKNMLGENKDKNSSLILSAIRDYISDDIFLEYVRDNYEPEDLVDIDYEVQVESYWKNRKRRWG